MVVICRPALTDLLGDIHNTSSSIPRLLVANENSGFLSVYLTIHLYFRTFVRDELRTVEGDDD